MDLVKNCAILLVCINYTVPFYDSSGFYFLFIYVLTPSVRMHTIFTLRYCHAVENVFTRYSTQSTYLVVLGKACFSRYHRRKHRDGNK